MPFNITSEFKPTGDQPEAIRQLTEGIRRGDRAQTLLGVTGSGKTFTVANVIQEVQRPTLILSHNKTLAAQLYGEFKNFFPENAVEYFVSYYDYYQPEAFIPSTNTYIEKDLAINEEIEKLRLSATTALLSGREDVIVVSSVSCIYGIGNPSDFKSNTIRVREGERVSRNAFLHRLVTSLYSRTETDFDRGTFRVRGDTVDVFIAYGDIAYRFYFFGDEIEEIAIVDPINGKTIEKQSSVIIYPANIFVTNPERQLEAIWQIQEDMVKQVDYMKSLGQHLEAKRLEDRVTYDLEMIRELGY
ncbi:MAG: DEAD/DEAH box helicase family protein, partial [Bacteroidota bacterium]